MHPTTQTKPCLFRLGKPLAVDTAIADPSITLIEVGTTWGFLLAESCHDDEAGIFHLDEVTWVRLTSGQRLGLFSRSFAEIALYRNSASVFVAHDPDTRKFLPRPSVEAYYVVFLTRHQYAELQQLIEQGDAMHTTEAVGPLIQELPGCAFGEWGIIASPYYASVDDKNFERNML